MQGYYHGSNDYRKYKQMKMINGIATDNNGMGKHNTNNDNHSESDSHNNTNSNSMRQPFSRINNNSNCFQQVDTHNHNRQTSTHRQRIKLNRRYDQEDNGCVDSHKAITRNVNNINHHNISNSNDRYDKYAINNNNNKSRQLLNNNECENKNKNSLANIMNNNRQVNKRAKSIHGNEEFSSNRSNHNNKNINNNYQGYCLNDQNHLKSVEFISCNNNSSKGRNSNVNADGYQNMYDQNIYVQFTRNKGNYTHNKGYDAYNGDNDDEAYVQSVANRLQKQQSIKNTYSQTQERQRQQIQLKQKYINNKCRNQKQYQAYTQNHNQNTKQYQQAAQFGESRHTHNTAKKNQLIEGSQYHLQRQSTHTNMQPNQLKQHKQQKQDKYGRFQRKISGYNTNREVVQILPKQYMSRSRNISDNKKDLIQDNNYLNAENNKYTTSNRNTTPSPQDYIVEINKQPYSRFLNSQNSNHNNLNINSNKQKKNNSTDIEIGSNRLSDGGSVRQNQQYQQSKNHPIVMTIVTPEKNLRDKTPDQLKSQSRRKSLIEKSQILKQKLNRLNISANNNPHSESKLNDRSVSILSQSKNKKNQQGLSNRIDNRSAQTGKVRDKNTYKIAEDQPFHNQHRPSVQLGKSAPRKQLIFNTEESNIGNGAKPCFKTERQGKGCQKMSQIENLNSKINSRLERILKSYG